ncbi:MAG: hypothetical protein AB7F21_07000 [Desulfuromonadales bacterium]
MKAVLSVDIPVTRIAVFAEISWVERRPELGLLCRAARNNGNRIAGAAVQSMLPGLPESGVDNIVAWCRDLGLCDQRGGLTSLGEGVAETDEAPVPEQGVFGLWLAQHPVIGRRVLAVDRRTSVRDSRYNEIQDLPIEPETKRVFRSVADSRERFMLRNLSNNHGQRGCLIEPTQSTCRLRWTLDFSVPREYWQLDGSIESPQGNGRYNIKPIEHMPESSDMNLPRLADTWGRGPLSAFGEWESDEGLLKVPLDNLSDEEQDSFEKNLQLESIEVSGYGQYNNVTVEKVPIGPATAAEAQKWAFQRIGRHLLKNPGYRSREELRRVFIELVEETPLEKFSPALHAHDTLVGGNLFTQNPEFYWSLVAPVDLAPRPVSAADLGTFRIGVPASEVVSELPGVVRVPYRSGWSMKQFVERTLEGVAPRKVLLCDRYVRGFGNLESLKMFVESIREIEPAAVVEVWTQEEDADFLQIQEITGTRPRSYKEVFDHRHPHDRYMLVLPTDGTGFGWHMSNSPLHARPNGAGTVPGAPLRWRDLAAAKFSAEELDPRLRQWFLEGVQ